MNTSSSKFIFISLSLGVFAVSEGLAFISNSHGFRFLLGYDEVGFWWLLVEHDVVAV